MDGAFRFVEGLEAGAVRSLAELAALHVTERPGVLICEEAGRGGRQRRQPDSQTGSQTGGQAGSVK